MFDSLWLGTETSYMQACTAYADLQKFCADKGIQITRTGPSAANPTANVDGEEDPYNTSEYMEVQNNVAIIAVEGTLRDGTYGWIGKFFGITGYGDIAEALMCAVKHPDVGSILMVYNTPGGAVSGVQELSNFIVEVDKLKPVHAFTQSMMASAGLWLGVGARKITSTDTAIVGSLGVLTVLASRHRQMKELGVDAHVVRSGKFKALGHPMEPLSEEAIAQAEDQVAYLSNIFLSYVASRRGVGVQAADRKFGQGREFIGQQAVDAGLVDVVGSYTDAYLSIKALAPSTDNKPRVFGAEVVTSEEGGHNAQQKEADMKILPTPEQLAAMAASSPEAAAALAAAAAQATSTKTTTVEPPAQAETQPTQVAVTIESLTAELATATASLTAQTTALAEAVAAKEVAESALLVANGQVETLTAQAALVGPLARIVRNGMKGMRVALNQQDTEVADAALATAHAELLATFTSKFKAGGVAATNPVQTSKEEPVQVNPLFKAALSNNRKK